LTTPFEVLSVPYLKYDNLSQVLKKPQPNSDFDHQSYPF